MAPATYWHPATPAPALRYTPSTGRWWPLPPTGILLLHAAPALRYTPSTGRWWPLPPTGTLLLQLLHSDTHLPQVGGCPCRQLASCYSSSCTQIHTFHRYVVAPATYWHPATPAPALRYTPSTGRWWPLPPTGILLLQLLHSDTHLPQVGGGPCCLLTPCYSSSCTQIHTFHR